MDLIHIYHFTSGNQYLLCLLVLQSTSRSLHREEWVSAPGVAPEKRAISSLRMPAFSLCGPCTNRVHLETLSDMQKQAGSEIPGLNYTKSELQRSFKYSSF